MEMQMAALTRNVLGAPYKFWDSQREETIEIPAYGIFCVESVEEDTFTGRMIVNCVIGINSTLFSMSREFFDRWCLLVTDTDVETYGIVDDFNYPDIAILDVKGWYYARN